MSSTTTQDILAGFQEDYVKKNSDPMGMAEFLELCKTDKGAYATPAERLLKAIGEPKMIDTSRDPRLSRIHQNKLLKVYPSFEGFHGMEVPIQKIVDHLTHASQGLEARKQILYLLGPVGGGKSSLADRIKSLMEKEPFYRLLDKDGNVSPINENPLGIFVGHPLAKKLQAPVSEGGFGIPARCFPDTMSPWAAKRLKEVNGDISKFQVQKVFPSLLNQIALSSTEPGDDNNQDISTLVGKIDIRKMERFSQNDPDAYSWDGGLCSANRGVLEFVEMFKAPIKVLNPLLAATQDRRFQGTEKIGAIPFEGIILAHSNESEWKAFSQNKRNEAFLDRVNIVKVPYVLQKNEEVLILKKLIDNSELEGKPCAPGTLEMMAEYNILSRLKPHENDNQVESKMRVYNGENIKETDPRAKSIQEYKDAAGVDEGMNGSSTRFSYKVLSKTFNFHSQGKAEIAANPIHLLYVLEDDIRQLQSPDEEKLIGFVKGLAKNYAKELGKEIQTAYIESYAEYGQNLFDRYVKYADFWIQDQEFRDPDTGEVLDRKLLAAELEKIEKPAGVANPKDFRNEIVNYVLRQKASNGGNNPDWTSYEKLKTVIEKKMFTSTEEMLPVIQFGAKSSGDMEKKHNNYVENMAKRGYTPQQVRLVTDWWLKHRLSA